MSDSSDNISKPASEPFAEGFAKAFGYVPALNREPAETPAELIAWLDMLDECDPETPAWNQARSALLALYNRQREEIDGWIDIAANDKVKIHDLRDQIASLSSQLERQRKIVNDIALLFRIETTSDDVVVETVRGELERLKAENERLKRVGLPEGLSEAIGTTGHIVERLHASQLTAEEAQFCLDQLHYKELSHDLWKAVTAKLRALSKGKGE